MITGIWLSPDGESLAVEMDDGDSGIAIVNPLWDGNDGEPASDWRELWKAQS